MNDAPTATREDSSRDVWRVWLSTGQTLALSLDELDDAFQNGRISAETRVLAPGSTTWSTLAEVAGIEASVEPAMAAASSLSPVAADVPSSRASVGHLAPPSLGAMPQSSLASTSGRQTLDDAADLSSARCTSDAQMSAVGSVEHSAQLEDLRGLDEHTFRPRRGRVAAIVLGGVAAALALVVVGAKLAGSVDATAATSSMRTTSAAAPAREVESFDVEARARELSEEQKRRLLEADKEREAARKAKTATPSARESGGPREKRGPFVQGGSKYDPLNGTL